MLYSSDEQVSNSVFIDRGTHIGALIYLELLESFSFAVDSPF